MGAIPSSCMAVTSCQHSLQTSCSLAVDKDINVVKFWAYDCVGINLLSFLSHLCKYSEMLGSCQYSSWSKYPNGYIHVSPAKHTGNSSTKKKRKADVIEIRRWLTLREKAERRKMEGETQLKNPREIREKGRRGKKEEARLGLTCPNKGKGDKRKKH